MRALLCCLLVVLGVPTGLGQAAGAQAPDAPAGAADSAAHDDAAPLTIPLQADAWQVEAEDHAFVEHLGRRALRLQGGTALIPGLALERGVVECDIAFGPERCFAGVQFHRRDGLDHEHVYLRPHRSGHPDASQYQPVVRGHAAWQLLGDRAFAAPLVHRIGAWQRLRLVIDGDGVDVHVDGGPPALTLRPLLHPDGGSGLALQASAHAPVWFSRVRVQPLDAVELAPVPVPDTSPLPGTITRWQVSRAFDEARLDGAPDLAELAPPDRILHAFRGGLVNLAEGSKPGDGRTVLARVTLRAERSLRVPLELGYSDRATVFLDGQPLFRGDQGYRRQDHRFLGTVGPWDTIFLPLTPGEHELAVAVSEDFGGWGLTGRLEPTPGLQVLAP